MNFGIGDILNIKGSTPYWNTLQTDVEIIGISNLKSIIDSGVDFYTLYFSGKNIDELYNTYLDSNISVYIGQGLTRNPFSVNKITGTTGTTTYIYFCDEILDLNNTKILKKRTNLTTTINIGNIDTEKVTTTLKTELKTKFINLCNTYTNTGYVGNFVETIIGQDKTISDAEDVEFERLKQERLDAEAAAEALIQARIQAIVDRENLVNQHEQDLLNREEILNDEREQVQILHVQLDERVVLIDNRENLVEQREDTLSAQELDLLNNKNTLRGILNQMKTISQGITLRETELSLPLTDWTELNSISII